MQFLHQNLPMKPCIPIALFLKGVYYWFNLIKMGLLKWLLSLYAIFNRLSLPKICLIHLSNILFLKNLSIFIYHIHTLHLVYFSSTKLFLQVQIMFSNFTSLQFNTMTRICQWMLNEVSFPMYQLDIRNTQEITQL